MLYKVEQSYYNVYVSYKTLQNITKHGGIRNEIIVHKRFLQRQMSQMEQR